MSIEPIAAVLGRVPSGLFVLSARRGDEELGMLASWVMQAGFNPPMITVALGRDRPLADWLIDGVAFVVSVLSADQRPLVRHFGRGFASGESVFDGIPIHRAEGEIPTPSGAIGYLRCEPISHIDSEDHLIFLARVVDGQLDDGQKPMVHIRKNGLKY